MSRIEWDGDKSRKRMILQVNLHWTGQGSSDATTCLSEDEAQSPSEGWGQERKDLGR